jgi:hypothetical protein
MGREIFWEAKVEREGGTSGIERRETGSDG